MRNTLSVINQVNFNIRKPFLSVWAMITGLDDAREVDMALCGNNACRK